MPPRIQIFWDMMPFCLVCGSRTTQTTWILIKILHFAHTLYLFDKTLRIKSEYFPQQINWFVPYWFDVLMKKRCVYYEVRTEFIHIMLFQSTPRFHWLNWNGIVNVLQGPIRISAKTPNILSEVRVFFPVPQDKCHKPAAKANISFSDPSNSL